MMDEVMMVEVIPFYKPNTKREKMVDHLIPQAKHTRGGPSDHFLF
jgi:hypothetical protein